MTFAWQSKILIRITLGDQYHRIYYKKTIKKKKGRAGTLQLPWRSILHKINGTRRQFIAILLSIEHHPLTCKTNTKNKKKRLKLEKNTLAGRSLSYSKLSGSKRRKQGVDNAEVQSWQWVKLKVTRISWRKNTLIRFRHLYCYDERVVRLFKN